jgi:predicted RNA-binding Zn ribbon-like protein
MLPLLEVALQRDRRAIDSRSAEALACRLVILDGSKDGTRRWCDDAGCGNRDRVRRHRRRSPGQLSQIAGD